MKRRDFLVLGTGATLATCISAKPAPAVIPVLIRLLVGVGIEFAAQSLFEGLFGAAFDGTSRRQEWYDSRLDAQLAQEQYFQRKFAKQASDIVVAKIPLSSDGHIFVAERSESLGINPAVCFSHRYNGRTSTSSFSGPACVGLAYAAKYLRETMQASPEEIRSILMPRQKDYDDWERWNQPTSYTSYTTETARNGVLIEYRAVEPRPGGYGEITISIDSYRHIQIPIRVQYT